MSRVRVYIKPFLDDGSYAPEFIEVTGDVVQLGVISQAIDDSNYDVGTIRNGGVAITLRNDHGFYNEADNIKSIFRYKRKDSLVKFTWDVRDFDLVCGFFTIPTPLGSEVELFQGVLNEISSVSDIDKQWAKFTVLGFESLLDGIEAPFSSINNGDLLSEILYAALNQAPFTDFITVDSGNISLGNDTTIDDKSDWENETVGGVLKDLLLGASSVFYLKDQTAYVSARAPTGDVKYTFYGQGSIQGVESIINVPKIRDGLNRVFNYWTWPETTLRAKDDTSLQYYGIRKKQFELSLINLSSTAKIQAMLDANRTEFSFPKLELELITPINYGTLALKILDRVSIDYPTIYTSSDGDILPRYGLSNYGAVRYPFGQWTLTLTTDTNFKIISRKVDPVKETIIFGLREI